MLSKHLLEKYSKSPEGWSFTVFPAKRVESGFGALIGTRDETWRIQLDSVYSANPLMLGAKADIDADLIPRSKILSYGYRKLDNKAILAILQDFQSQSQTGTEESEESPLHDDYRAPWVRSGGSLERILSSLDLVSPKANEAYAEGPIVLTSRKGIEPLVDKQQELEDKLSAELKRMLKKKYSAYG